MLPYLGLNFAPFRYNGYIVTAFGIAAFCDSKCDKAMGIFIPQGENSAGENRHSPLKLWLQALLATATLSRNILTALLKLIVAISSAVSI